MEYFPVEAAELLGDNEEDQLGDPHRVNFRAFLDHEVRQHVGIDHGQLASVVGIAFGDRFLRLSDEANVIADRAFA